MRNSTSILNALLGFPLLSRHSRHTFSEPVDNELSFLSSQRNSDLDNFIRILMNIRSNSTDLSVPGESVLSNSSTADTNAPFNEYNKMPNFMASIFQLFTLIFVCLCCLCACKCNQMMEYFRRSLTNSPRVEVDVYRDRITCLDYICMHCRCYYLKKKLSFKKFQHQRISRNQLRKKNEKKFNRQRINIRKNSEKRILRNNSVRKKKDDSFRNRMVSTSSTISNNSGQSRAAFVQYTNSFRYKNPKYNTQERELKDPMIKKARSVDKPDSQSGKISIIKYKENPVCAKKSVKLNDVAEEIDV